MPRPSLTQLAIFVAVARQKGFQRAAGEMNLSTSAVSHAIRGLEGQLGLSLFNRTTRSVALTEAGEHLLARLQPLLTDIGELIDEMSAFRGRPSGRLRINTSHAAADMVIVPMMARFLTTFPEVTLDIVDTNELVDIVAAGFDAGLRFPESVPENMVAIPLGRTSRFALVVSPRWLSSHGPLTSPEHLLQHECVRYRFPSGRFFKWEFEKDGREMVLDPRGRVIVGDQSLAVAAAADGIGPAYVFEESAQDALASGRLVRMLEDWCPLFPGPVLYYPPQRRTSSALKAFIQMARQTHQSSVLMRE